MEKEKGEKKKKKIPCAAASLLFLALVIWRNASNPTRRCSEDWPPKRSRQHKSLECTLSYTHHGTAFEYWI